MKRHVILNLFAFSELVNSVQNLLIVRSGNNSDSYRNRIRGNFFVYKYLNF